MVTEGVLAPRRDGGAKMQRADGRRKQGTGTHCETIGADTAGMISCVQSASSHVLHCYRNDDDTWGKRSKNMSLSCVGGFIHAVHVLEQRHWPPIHQAL
ncbi:hypothetical protein AOLI_G00221400 [Acnodon oligacanthus]